jgi:hypothetical protein
MRERGYFVVLLHNKKQKETTKKRKLEEFADEHVFWSTFIDAMPERKKACKRNQRPAVSYFVSSRLQQN